MPKASSPLSRISPAPDISQQNEHKQSSHTINTTMPQSQQGMKSSKPKLRRKVSVEDALVSSTAVQRLVEYFIIVSSQPRWEDTTQLQSPGLNSKTKHSKLGGGRGEKLRSKAFRTPHRNQRASTRLDPDALISPDPIEPPTTKKKPRALFRFRSREKNSNEQLPNCTFDDEKKDVEEIHGAAENASSPEPRSEWTREEPCGENIHLPEDPGYDHSFQPKITARFPLEDHDDNPLNPMITQFCYPSGDIIVPSRTYELPRVHHFVLTNDKGRKIYGTCLTIFEDYYAAEDGPFRTRDEIHHENSHRDIEVTVSDGGTALYIPKVLCILSTWPYLTAFREYLSQLYRLASTTNVMQAPIERYVCNLCLEIPAPPPGAYEVQLSILNSTIRFWAPPAKLPIAYVALPYQTLFDCLDVDNILLLWNVLIMEHKILLVSSQYSILTVCSEILLSLLFPMRWCHLYVPLLPRFICPMLDAPVPYLCGVVRENWLYAQQFVSRETIVVDLDRNTVAFGELTPELMPAPTKKWSKLKAALDQTAGHLFWKTRGLEEEHKNLIQGRRLNLKRSLTNLEKKGSLRWKEKLHSFDHAFNLAYTPTSDNLLNDMSADSQQSQWDRVQEAFLRFFVALLKGYRKFLTKPEGSGHGIFHKQEFISAQKQENQQFLSGLCETQQLDDFIMKTLYSPGEPDVIFFNQSIDAKLNRSRLKLRKVDTPFLQSAKTHKVLKKVQAVQPNHDDLPESRKDEPFIYTIWPETFCNDLFSSPKPIPKMISAEFDRQAVLVSRLRLAEYKPHKESENGDRAVDETFSCFGGDFDTSPEVASFTVFFFTYSILIGQDWQQFQKKRKGLLFERSTKQNAQLSANSPENAEHEGANNGGLITPVSKDPANGANPEYKEGYSIALCDECTVPAVASTVPFMTPFKANFPDLRKFSLPRLSASVVKQNVNAETSKFCNTPAPNRFVALVDRFDDSVAEYEEARAVASAQLDLGFETLKTMALRELSPDADAYRSLMGACGRCGDTQRALQLIELMKRDGLVDGEVLSWFVTAFAQKDDADTVGSRFSPANRDNVKSPYQSSDAYYKFLERKLEALESQQLRHSQSCLAGLLSDESEDDVSIFSDDSKTSSVASAPVQSTSFVEWLTPHKKQKAMRKRKSKRRRRKSSLNIGMPVSDVVGKQVLLAENLLDFLYPSLSIDTSSDSCPQCSAEMNEADIIQGWIPCALQDYTTCCHTCKHRFVPRFAVTNLAPDFHGSQGLGTPLYCEFLSPWVLRKELEDVAKSTGGIESMTQPEWRSGTDIHSTLWWNMIILCRKYRLPFAYLLQGSFQNRLINPTP